MLSQHTELDSITPHKSLVYAWDGVIVYVTQDHLNKAHAHFPALLQIGLELLSHWLLKINLLAIMKLW
jgi:hypothetical protein